MLDQTWFDLSSWGFGLTAVVYIVISERRFMHERQRLRRVAGQVEPSAIPTPTGDASVVRTAPSRDRFDDRLRSVLIQVAVDALPFALAVERSRRFAASRADVEHAACALRASRLLRFADPLRDDTKLRLS